MHLTRASTYALHALAYMAAQKTNSAIASHKIAQEKGIPERFLLKVLKPLVSHRILDSVKGPNGGYKLARVPADITLLEVVEAVEGGKISGQAPPPEVDQDKFPNFNTEPLVPLFKKLDNVCKKSADMVRDHLGKVRLSDLLRK